MHKRFEHKDFERKWQEKWDAEGLYNVDGRDSKKEKQYVLAELPYPSGNLHIGHWYAFAVPDIYVRYLRMSGKEVIYPMGFDAFGLPAENAAIKRDINPREWTEGNIEYMRDQLASMGNAFTWNKTVSTTDPDYYKWTQWMFTQFFENDIAYRGEGVVNWCPHDNTVIANEQVLADNTCERCGNEIEKKQMPQWMLRITDYADELIDDLESLDWPEFIKESQRNWIGRSEGSEINFELSTEDTVSVFTTRADTLYGVTYLVLAPEHKLVLKNRDAILNFTEVESYISEAKKKAEQDRLDGSKEKTGVKLEGITAINPANNEEIPVYIADYVLAGYGTGAIMAVPGHDERDNEFAKKYDLPITQVIANHLDSQYKEGVEMIERGDVIDIIIEHPTNGTFLLMREEDKDSNDHVHFVGGGTDDEDLMTALKRELEEETGFTEYEVIDGPVDIMTCHAYRHNKKVNQSTKSYFYHIKLTSLEQIKSEIDEGLHTVEWVARNEVLDSITWEGHRNAWENFLKGFLYIGTGSLVNSAEFNGMDSEEAKVAITEKVGGKMTNTYRLRDWSIGRQRYWGVPIPIVYDPEGKAHPVPKEHLPWTLPEDVDFRPTGEPPLAKSQELLKRTEKIFGEGWTPEVETMDTFVDSSWYFMRYIDNQNQDVFASLDVQKDWLPVDLYFGGAEHTTMHLLYSRFWMKALHKLGLSAHKEPYKKRINRSLILGPDGNKMSKSKGNVVDPDEQVERVGSDAVKMYLAFMGPYAEVNNYPWDLGGIAGIRRFLERVNGLREHVLGEESEETTKLLHKTIKKVGEDILEFKFNTAISAMMVFINHAEKKGLSSDSYNSFLKILAPFAPHLAEELWSDSSETSIHITDYPDYDPELIKDTETTIGVQINGKLRGDITIAPDASQEEAEKSAYQNSSIASKLDGATIVKIVYVPGRILNFIIKNE